MTPVRGPSEHGRADSWAFCLLAAIVGGLQFQFVISMGPTELKICPADLAALSGAVLVVALSLRDRCLPWATDFKGALLVLPTYALTLGLFVAYARYGHVSNWALIGKYAGWFVLLAYLVAGAGLIMRGDGVTLAMCLRAFCWLTVIVNAVFYIPRVSYVLYIPIPGVLNLIALWKLRVYGDQQASPVGNDNGSAVMLICVLAIVLADRVKPGSVFRAATAFVLAAVVCVNVIMTGSRAGMAAAALLLMIAFVMATSARRFILALAAVTGLFVGATQLANFTHVNEAGVSEDRVLPHRNRADAGVYDVSVMGRLDTAKAAVMMALEHPILGGGLGAFLAGQDQNALIIHNTLLWILAEMGIAGVAAFLLFFAGLIRYLVKANRSSNAQGVAANAALLTLVSVGAMAMAHELLYQRAPWFLLGLALAGRRRLQTT